MVILGSEVSFGSWLKQRRRERGIGPDALAEEIGIEAALQPTWAKTANELQVIRAKAIDGAATLAYEMGDKVAGRALYEESLPICREIGHRFGVAYALHCLAVLTFLQGDHEDARVLLQESLNMQGITCQEFFMAANLAGFGTVASTALSGAFRGAKLLGASDALRASLGVVWTPDDRVIYEACITAAHD